MGGSRGQAESLGVLFAVGITLVLSVTVFLTFGSLGGTLTDAPPGARIDVQTAGSTVTLTHESGEVLDTETLTLVFRQGDEERRVALSSVASGEFAAGDTLSVTHGLGDGELAIRLVHEPTNGVLVNVERTVEDAFGVSLSVSESGGTYTFTPRVSGGVEGAPAVTTSSDEIEGFGGSNQDKTGSATVTDDGRGVRLEGNSWKAVPYDYVVTGDTVVSFEYRSDESEGEIHGLSLEGANDGSISARRTVQVWGTQRWARLQIEDTGATRYTAGAGWQTYEITASQLDAFSAGTSERIRTLALVNDDDGNVDDGVAGEGETHVRNVRLYESGADYQYRWEVNGNLVSNEPTLTRSLSSGDTVTLTVVDAEGRTTTATYTVR
jgi:hypothetical protein